MSEKDQEAGVSLSNGGASSPPPSTTLSSTKKFELHPAFFVAIWIFFSGSVILFNKWVLDTAGFRFPIFLTTWHLVFATIMTQILARTTSLLDGLKTVKMDGKTYLHAIVPIGLFFSLSLIASNHAYLYLSVAFIQMLKATMPVAVLLTTWSMRIEPINLNVLGNVSVIVLGIIIASYGEIAFVFVGFVFQAAGIVFESLRLALVQKILSSPEYKMDPLVSLYYFAPVCAAMNAVCCLVFEGPSLSLQAILDAGIIMLFMNAAVAFCLNVAVVFLIGKTSSLVLTLSGVLKDILLVALSVIIWGTEITALQLFGYAIALAGLIWYKLGSEQARATYMKLAGDESSAFNRFRRSLWAKVGVGLLVIFVVLATAHGFTRGRGVDRASMEIGLSGNPEPEMVDAIHSDSEGGWHGDSHGIGSTWDDITPSTHYTTEVVDEDSYYPLDIVIYVSPTDSGNTTLKSFEQLLELPAISSMTPRTTVYSASASDIEVFQQMRLGRINSASAAFLDYISNNYESLAQHTIFLHTNIDVQHLVSTVAARFQPRTGVADLGASDYSVCTCLECTDRTHSHLTKTDELYALTNQDICSSTTRLLLSEDALFIASSRRLRQNFRAVYSHLLSALEENDTALERSVAKSWMYMLGCNDLSIAGSCVGIGSQTTECQCID